MAQRTYAALDHTGTQAAVYPSEDALWVNGPPVNDPGDQGVQYPGSPGRQPPEPRSVNDALAMDAFIEDTLNGETSNGAYGEMWVNLGIVGPAGYGPYNDPSEYQTGHSQNVVSNPAAEQGWGVGPARRWAHYPFSELPNPYRNESQHLRNGQLPWVAVDSSLYERSQLAWEQQWAPFKRRSPVAPVVPVPVSVPFVQTVPTFGGGPIQYAGIDVPIGDEGLFG